MLQHGSQIFKRRKIVSDIQTRKYLHLDPLVVTMCSLASSSNPGSDKQEVCMILRFWMQEVLNQKKYDFNFDPRFALQFNLPVNTGQHRPDPGDHCDEAVHQEDPGLVDRRAVGGQDHDAGDEHDDAGEEERTPGCNLPFGYSNTPQLLQTLGITATHSSEIFRICCAMLYKRQECAG